MSSWSDFVNLIAPAVVSGQSSNSPQPTVQFPVSVLFYNSADQTLSSTNYYNQDQQNVPAIFQIRQGPPVPSTNSTNSSSLSSYQTNVSVESSTTNIRGIEEIALQDNPPTYEQVIGLQSMQQPAAFIPICKS